MCPQWFLTDPSLGKAKQACEEVSECFTQLLSELRKTQRNVFFLSNLIHWLPWWLSDKESSYRRRRHGLDSRVRKIRWRRKWLLTPVFLPGEFHGQSSLVGYSSLGHKRVGHDLAAKQQQPPSLRFSALVLILQWKCSWRLRSDKGLSLEIGLCFFSPRTWLGFSALFGLIWMVFYQSDKIIFDYYYRSAKTVKDNDLMFSFQCRAYGHRAGW